MNRPRKPYVATRMLNFGAILNLPRHESEKLSDPCPASTY